MLITFRNIVTNNCVFPLPAPKGSTSNVNQPTKIITSVPKLAGQSGNTQFIVVSPQSVAGAVAAGK